MQAFFTDSDDGRMINYIVLTAQNLFLVQTQESPEATALVGIEIVAKYPKGPDSRFYP